MPVNYTNRKGLHYTLYKGETKTGKPRYYFGRTDQSQGQGEPVAELPPGFTISESVNGIVSLIKDRPSSILPEEVAAVEEALKVHPEARQYRIAVRHNMIEIYEQISPNFETVLDELQYSLQSDPSLADRLRYEEERYAHFTPVLRFTLVNPTQRWFSVKRMYYGEEGTDSWLELKQTGLRPVAELAHELTPTLGTDQFFELW
jgi:hypothetical protein